MLVGISLLIDMAMSLAMYVYVLNCPHLSNCAVCCIMCICLDVVSPVRPLYLLSASPVSLPSTLPVNTPCHSLSMCKSMSWARFSGAGRCRRGLGLSYSTTRPRETWVYTVAPLSLSSPPYDLVSSPVARPDSAESWLINYTWTNPTVNGIPQRLERSWLNEWSPKEYGMADLIATRRKVWDFLGIFFGYRSVVDPVADFFRNYMSTFSGDEIQYSG